MLDLIEKARHRDGHAFTVLIQAHMQSMYKVARSILWSDEDAADAIQDTILSCWRNINGLREPEYFKTWLIRILINICRDYAKHQTRQTDICLGDETLAAVPAKDGAYENVEWKETLKLLDEKYRLIMVLYYVEGFRTSEIAKMLDIPEATIRTRLARGRKKLSDIFRKEDGRRAQ